MSEVSNDKRRLDVRIVALLFITQWFVSFCFAQTDLVCMQEACGGVQCVYSSIDMYRDPTGSLNLTQVRSLEARDWTSISDKIIQNIGYTRDTVWLHITFRSERDTPFLCCLELGSTRINYMDWYIMAGSNVIHHAESGSLVPFQSAMPELRKPSLAVDLPAYGTRDVYVKIRSEAAMQIAIRVQRASRFVGSTAKGEAQNAFLLGTLFGLLFLAYLLAWATGDRFNLYYALGMTCIGLTFPIMGGYHVWLGLPGQKVLTHAGVLILTDLGMILLLGHCSVFLKAKQSMPRLHRIMVFLCVMAVIATPVAVMLPYRIGVQFTIIIILASTLCMAVAAVIGMVGRSRDAWFYAAGNGVFWIYMWIQMMFYYGVVKINVLPETLGLICISLSLVAFFISMIKRVRVLRQENDRAQKRAWLVKEQAARELESLVAQRTCELRAAKECAEWASSSKTAFISQVSHDLRAPLNWLIGLVESLWLESKELRLSQDFMDYLQHIKRGGYYLSQLLNNMLDASALDVGKPLLNLREFDVRQWAGSAECIAQAVAHTSNITLCWDLDVQACSGWIRSDPARLAQVLMNLVHNAVKYSPEDTDVHVVISLHDACLTLLVWDEGDGLPDESMTLFDSYAKGRNQENLLFQGVGLGLHIVKSNVEMLNGRISVKNLEHAGASFTVTFDVIPVDEGKD